MRLFGFFIAQVKIQPISHVTFQSKSEFFFKLWIIVQCHERTLLFFFSWNCKRIGQKEPIKVPIKCQTFDCSYKISPNLYFDRLLKVCTILAKKYRGVISHDPEDWCKIWRKTDLLFQKWQEFGEIWPEHLQVSTTCTFTCSYCAKYLMFDLKKYRVVIFHDTEEWCKIEKVMKNWLAVWKMTWGISQIFTRALERVKLELWWEPFVQSRKCMSLKFTEELCVMAMKNATKIEKELICRFKIDMRNFANFDPSTLKSQKFVV